MSLYLYDTALIDKFKSWTRDTDLHVYGTEETRRLFEAKLDENKDKPIKLPMVCLKRHSTTTIVNPNLTPKVIDGYTIEASISTSLQLNAIPIKLDYTLDIYSRYYQEADELSRNFLFNLLSYPTVQIILPYQGKQWKVNSYIKLNEEYEDTSGIEERLNLGQFTRFSINFSLEDAYLWDIRARDNISIETIFQEG